MRGIEGARGVGQGLGVKLGVIARLVVALSLLAGTSVRAQDSERADTVHTEDVAPSRAARRILATARRMVRRRTIVRGSCFDYIERVFRRAGYPASRRARVFSSVPEGPYADLSLIAPGDWLFILPHPEREPVLTHSVIFVRWLDREAGRAEVVSYAGNHARRPGGIVPYDLNHTYVIARAQD